MLHRIRSGRTDLVVDYLKARERDATSDEELAELLRSCAYFGDVSALRFLVSRGAALAWLGTNLDLNGAAFHGHWQLCEFLIENRADVNGSLAETGETPLHAALCSDDRLRYDLVLQVLLGRGANPNVATKPNVETGGFMRDSRTRGETPLHRAAAFGTVETIGLLIDAGAKLDVKDMNGDSPLSWASWYRRPPEVLRRLCYGGFRIPSNYGHGLRANLMGTPLAEETT